MGMNGWGIILALFGAIAFGQSQSVNTFDEGFFSDGSTDEGVSVWSEGFFSRMQKRPKPTTRRGRRKQTMTCSLSTAMDPYTETKEVEAMIQNCIPETINRSRIVRSVDYGKRGNYKVKAYTQICCVRSRRYRKPGPR